MPKPMNGLAKRPVQIITTAEIAAGVAALLKFADRVSTKKDPEGAVRAILEAAKKALK